MPLRLSDAEIAALIAEEKNLPLGYRRKLVLKEKHGHKERELKVSGASGHSFQIILRESNFNPLDFSAILAYLPVETNIAFRLRRYNGKSHEHTNKIEKQTLFGFHIHIATERYQEFGEGKEDAYAEITDRYGDLLGALDCLLKDCGFVLPPEEEGVQFNLFQGSD